MYQVSSVLQIAETDDLFDPLEDSQTLNTFTRRDHLFARLDFILEKAAVTLYHQDKMKPLLNESGVIQLEFSGFICILYIHLLIAIVSIAWIQFWRVIFTFFYFAWQVWRSESNLFLAQSLHYSQWNLVGCFSVISLPRAPSFLSLFHQNQLVFFLTFKFSCCHGTVICMKISVTEI